MPHQDSRSLAIQCLFYTWIQVVKHDIHALITFHTATAFIQARTEKGDGAADKN